MVAVDKSLGWGLVLVGMLLGCTEATPNYCQKNSHCPAGQVCDVARAVCSLADAAGGVDGGLDGGLIDGSPDRLPGEPTRLDATAGDGDGDATAAIDGPPALDGGALDQATDTGAVDVAAPDVYIPDAPGTCATNGDCADPSKPFCVGYLCVGCQAAGTAACGAQVCDPTSGRCADCTTDDHCTKEAAKGFCVANTCTGCTTVGATGCARRSDGKTVCATKGPAVDQCVACAADSDCTVAGASFCVANACAGCQAAPATGCSARSTSKPVCAPSGDLGGQCVECVADGDCKEAGKSFCVANACTGCQAAAKTACSVRAAGKPVCATRGALEGQCVACQVDGDCTGGATPICDANNACTRCTADSQCAAKLGPDPGVCMAHQDGRCATDGETVYVASSAACAASGAQAGTAAQPLCTLQSAVTLLGTDTGKQLIVLRSAADAITVTRAAQVSLVGQNTASIATGAGSPGITLSGTGNLYVRDLSVVGSAVSNVGVSAGAGTTLALERVKVLGNGGGGILLAGAAFRLNDVLVRGNGTGVDGSTTWSGIYVKALPNAGAATQLGLVSIVDNGSPGLNCGFALPPSATASATVHAANNGGATGIDILPICGVASCAPAAAGVCGSSLVP